jgi:hypothetical protein
MREEKLIIETVVETPEAVEARVALQKHMETLKGDCGAEWERVARVLAELPYCRHWEVEQRIDACFPSAEIGKGEYTEERRKELAARWVRDAQDILARAREEWEDDQRRAAAEWAQLRPHCLWGWRRHIAEQRKRAAEKGAARARSTELDPKLRGYMVRRFALDWAEQHSQQFPAEGAKDARSVFTALPDFPGFPDIPEANDAPDHICTDVWLVDDDGKTFGR